MVDEGPVGNASGVIWSFVPLAPAHCKTRWVSSLCWQRLSETGGQKEGSDVPLPGLTESIPWLW